MISPRPLVPRSGRHHILSYEDDGSVVFFEGNYTEYEADRKKRLGDAASQPHRVKYKKLAQ